MQRNLEISAAEAILADGVLYTLFADMPSR